MAKPVYIHKGLNLVLVVACLFALGGSAYYLSTNTPVNLKSGASNLAQTATGKLVKKGAKEFTPCINPHVAYTYGLLAVKKGINVCTSLVVNAKLADPLVGKMVIATGTLQSGVFYATSLRLASATPKPTPKPPTPAPGTPTPKPSSSPTPPPAAKYCGSVSVVSGAHYGGTSGGKQVYFISSGGSATLQANVEPSNIPVKWIGSNSSNLPDGGTFSPDNTAYTIWTAPVNANITDEGVDIRADISEYPNPWLHCPTFTMVVLPK